MKREMSCQKLRQINVPEFKKDLIGVFSFSFLNDCVDDTVDRYNVNVKNVKTKHAPKRTKTVTLRTHSSGWYGNQLRNEKREKIRCERKFRKTKLEVHRQIFHEACRKTYNMSADSKRIYYSSRIRQHDGDSKALFKLAKDLMGSSQEVTLPSHTSSKELAHRFNKN